METIGGRDVATDVRAVPILVRVSFHSSLGEVTIRFFSFSLSSRRFDCSVPHRVVPW